MARKRKTRKKEPEPDLERIIADIHRDKALRSLSLCHLSPVQQASAFELSVEQRLARLEEAVSLLLSKQKRF